MVEPIKEKLAIKALEKFGKTVELCLAQIPNNDTLEEEEVCSTEAAEQTNMNNTTKLFRKRALFSQTCNTLLETEENIAAQESPIPQASIKDLVNQGGNSSSDDNDSDAVGQVKPTPPKKATKTTKRKKTNNKESSCSDSDGRKRRPNRILVDEN